MQKSFLIEETFEIQEILNESYAAIFAALKTQRPEVTSLIDDDDISILHDLYALIKTRQIYTKNLSDDKGTPYISLTIQSD